MLTVTTNCRFRSAQLTERGNWFARTLLQDRRNREVRKRLPWQRSTAENSSCPGFDFMPLTHPKLRHPKLIQRVRPERFSLALSAAIGIDLLGVVAALGERLASGF